MLVVLFSSNVFAKQLRDGSFYHECKFDSATSGGAPPHKSFRLRYTIGAFYNQTLYINNFQLSGVNTYKGHAEGYFSFRDGTNALYTFDEAYRSAFITIYNARGEETYIGKYICSP